MLFSVPQIDVPAIEALRPLLASPLTAPTLAPLTSAPVPEALWAQQRPQKPKPKKKGYRRVSRAMETTEIVIRSAIPAGLRRASHTDEVLAALDDDFDFALRRSDFKRKVRRCLDELIACVDFSTMTTRPGHKLLQNVLAVHERTVLRYLQALEVMGLLAVVASGRQAEYATVGEDGQRINEASLYVLCVPKERQTPESKMARWLGLTARGVRRSATPTSEAGTSYRLPESTPRTRAKNRDSQSFEQKKQNLTVDEVRWNRHRAPESRAQRLTAAWRLRTLLPNILRRMSDRDIASTVRVFFKAGWSPADIHHALQFQPFDGQWPYAGAPDTTAPHRVRGWMKYRLAAWLDADGTPVRSKGQKDRERWARESAEREEVARREHQRQQALRAGADPEVRVRALARMREKLAAEKGAA